MGRNEAIEAIYAIELDMFQSVQDTNGKAPCQAETDTFRVMRLSLLQTWPEELLASYLYDLEFAKALGFNLMSEKYARMMESTHPEEYEKIKDDLPMMTEEKKLLVSQLTEIMLDWEKDIFSRYPFLANRGRPLDSKDDSAATTSFETYTRGELSTYSLNTLSIYHYYCQEAYRQGFNRSESVYEGMVKMYGFPSLKEAAVRLGAQAANRQQAPTAE